MTLLPKHHVLTACTVAACLLVTACGGGDAESPPNSNTPPPVTEPTVDTTPPVLTITDSVPGATASGAVTFTFIFTEDVGTSFGIDDIVVTGGTAGSLTRTSGTMATLVVTPTVGAASGTLGVSVAAGAFSDIAGNASTAAVSATQDFGTAPTTAVLVLSFDESPEAFSDLGAYGGALPTIETGPAGGSAKALKIVKPTSPDTWGGTFFTTAKIPFTADKKSISARVYSSKAGAVITFKVQVSETDFVEVVGAPTGAANTWSTVTWDFSAVSLSKNYNVIAITPDVTAVTNGQSYFIDEISVVAGTVTPPPPPVTGLVLSFDESPEAFSDLGAYGGALPTIETGPAGGSAKALKIVKPTSPDTWGGTFFTTAKIPFTADKKSISARVYSSKAGAVITFKVQVSETDFVEVVGAPTGAANTWSTVTWDFSAVSLSKTYNVIAITPDVTAVTNGQSYFIDEISVVAGTVTPPPVTGSTLVTFDETPALLVAGFGGAEGTTTVEAGPSGGTGKALKLVRSGGDVYAGAIITTGKIGFTADRKTITALVHSSKAGVPIFIKAEGASGLQTPDAKSTTEVVVGWQTLTFVLAPDITKTYDKLTLLPDLNTVGTGQTYFFDDIKLLEAGAGPVIAAKTIATLDETGAQVVGFEGAWDSTIVTDPKGGTNKVGRVVKPGSGVPFYAGTTIVTVANGGLPTIPFSDTAKTMTVRVWSPDANIPVRLKLEDIADGTKSVETEVLTTVAGGWQTMTFNFANPVSGTAALNLATTYNKASIFFNFGTAGSGKTYYFDDMTFVTGTGSNLVLSSFDESKPRVLKDFGGIPNSTIVGASGGLPAGVVGKGAKVVKASGSEIWAGTSVVAKDNDGVPTIPFVTGAMKMTMRVLSAYPPGVRVHLKVEQAGSPQFNSEVDAFTTKTNEWETLTFDFGPDATHAIPTGPGPNDYPKPPAVDGYTSQLDVSKTFNKVSVYFDFGLGDAGYAGMPDTRTYYFDQLRFIGK